MAPIRLVYIAGAGISGLTLALALARFGLRVVVLERNEAVSEVGAGIQISPNARKILDRLGLGEALYEYGFEPAGIDVIPSGRIQPIQTLGLGEAVRTRFGAPYAVIHRGDLAQALFEATKRFANIEVLFGVENFSVRPTEAGVAVSYTQTGRAPVSGPGFAFVGADGVNSTTRSEALSLPEAQPAGVTAWRVLAKPADLGNGIRPDRTTLLLAPRHHMVIYPLPRRRMVNLVLLSARRRDQAVSDEPGMPGDSDHKVIATLLHRTGARWTPWTIRTHPRHAYGEGPIALVGDAAHAMLPFQAQGAAMGIEDAATLATLLATAPNPSFATLRYRALREDRVRRVAELSKRNGDIFHMGWPVARARDAVIALGGPEAHLKRLGWVYGFEIAQSPDGEAQG